ncbi:hypothetical protein FS749_009121 [Ceratobasidium sp. UAMH 11750]|nr:hypothetical protein FS749_009121 [Ceratobasidium sp. UAMH 11750]
MRTGTVIGLVKLKNDCHCPIIITGGTEVGHAPGKYSHANGYKVDIRHNPCIDNYIRTKFKRINRGDGFPQWRDPSGNIYYNEGNHWDV